uniref:Uncharacterized protein n=1 Tax=Arundo donax TaxID=35708 RepID=A0A0A9FMN1_ARUDO
MWITQKPGYGGFLTGAARGAGRGANLPPNITIKISIISYKTRNYMVSHRWN